MLMPMMDVRHMRMVVRDGLVYMGVAVGPCVFAAIMLMLMMFIVHVLMGMREGFMGVFMSMLLSDDQIGGPHHERQSD